jgi:phytoene dehydrogenase-like protein
MPAGIVNIEKSLAHTFDTDPVLLHNYLYKLKKSYSKSISYFVDKPVSIRSFSSLNALVSFGLIAPLMIQDLHRRNNRYLRDKKLVQLFDRYATYSGSNPYLTPALSILASGPEVIGGAYYPVGGMRSIADGLYQAGNDLGVKFNFNKPVKSIVQVSSRVEAVVTKKGVIKTNKVIYDGDARMLSVMLKKKPKPAKPSSMSTSAFAFYWVVKGDFKQFGLHNILFSDDYQKEYQQLSAGMISQDPTVFINITSKLEPGLTATGTENWFVMVNVPAGVGEHLLDKVRQSVLQKVFNVTGKKPIIIAEDYLSPKKLEQNTGAYSGAIYGQSANNLFLTIKKPSNKTNIKGLYRVGGTSHPGGGVPLAVRSATIVSKWL